MTDIKVIKRKIKHTYNKIKVAKKIKQRYDKNQGYHETIEDSYKKTKFA